MRILHVSDRASTRGGADWHLASILETLGERGHRQMLLVGRADGSATSPCALARLPGLDEALSEAPLDGLDEAVRAFDADLIHLHNALRPAVMRWAAARGAICTVQDHRSFCPGRGKLTIEPAPCEQAMSAELCRGCLPDEAYRARIQRITEARLTALRSMTHATVLSHYMQGELQRVGIERVTVIPPFVHGLEAGARSPSHVLFAGRLVEAKGVADAVDAWRRADVGMPLAIAGTGPLRARVEGVDGVELMGWVPHTAMAEVYRRSAALVMPSRWQEPFGIVGLEALWMGVPVAAYDSGGVRDWHPGDDLLVPWGDVDALAAALKRAVTRQATAATGFDREELMDRLEAIYRSARA